MWKWFAGLVIFLVLESTAILKPEAGWLGVVANSLSAALLVVAVVWFLRRRAAREAAASPNVGVASSWVSLKDRKFIFGAILVGIVGSGAGPILVRSSDAYTLTMATARDSASFTAALGAPVSEGWFSHSKFVYGEPPTADLEVSVSGPKAHGTLWASGIKSGDKWKLRRLTLQLASATEEIDLLK